MYELRVSDSQTGMVFSLVNNVSQISVDPIVLRQTIDALETALQVLYRVAGTAPLPLPDQITQSINTLSQKVDEMSDALHSGVDQLKTDFADLQAAVQAVITAFDDTLAKLADAIQQLQNAGAPADVVAAIADLHTGMASQIDALKTEAAKPTPAPAPAPAPAPTEPTPAPTTPPTT
jgi:ABC-type transporter Mla subunit MlaD